MLTVIIMILLSITVGVAIKQWELVSEVGEEDGEIGEEAGEVGEEAEEVGEIIEDDAYGASSVITLVSENPNLTS